VTDDDRVFKALADPTRRFLLDRLFARDGRTLTELESELEMTRFGVMKHLRVLDVTMAEPGAFISFAGPRVIEQAAKKKLPDDVNTAEFMLAHGMIDLVVPRAELQPAPHREP
jgi:DNA-binding transcriptional ArsR family regulator